MEFKEDTLVLCLSSSTKMRIPSGEEWKTTKEQIRATCIAASKRRLQIESFDRELDKESSGGFSNNHLKKSGTNCDDGQLQP